MEVKEAIEFLDNIFSRCKFKECNLQNLNKIIYLLEQGEKYRQRINKLIKELEKEMIGSRESDQFGYAKNRAIDVYHKVIRQLKEINIQEEMENQ